MPHGRAASSRRARRRTGAAKPRGSNLADARHAARFETLEPRSMLAAQFIINEFMAANATGLADGFGERSDWIEIRNAGDAAGDLAGYHLTDSANDPGMWTFPPGSVVQAGGYLVVFASGRDTI